MKKKVIIAMLAASSALTMTHAFAAAGTVNFNGNILDSACDVDVASQNQVVVLGDYYKTEFPATGSRVLLPLRQTKCAFPPSAGGFCAIWQIPDDVSEEPCVLLPPFLKLHRFFV